MNIQETAAVLAMVAAYDNRQPSQATVVAWADALADVDVADAQEAVRRHYRSESRWIMPADVRAGAAAVRRDRLERQPIALEELPEDGARYPRALRAAVAAIASGRSVERALAAAPRTPVGPPEEYRRVREDDPERVAAMTVVCPWCGKPPGESCVNALGSPLPGGRPHDARVAAAGGANGVESTRSHTGTGDRAPGAVSAASGGSVSAPAV